LAYARYCAGAIVVLWVAQLLLMGYFFSTAAWQTYWFCRDVYQPGLALFGVLGRPVLPREWFNPLDRTAILTRFAFAALFYSVVFVLGAAAAYRMRR
jgi:hypothetical protein